MKYKTFFRLLIKALGVYFTITGGFSALGTILSSCTMFLVYRAVSVPTINAWSGILHAPIGLLEAAVGLYLFFGGEWIVNKAIPGNRPYCPECGYDLSHAAGPICPECGTAVVHSQAMR